MQHLLAPDRWRFADSLAEGLYGIDLHGHCTFVNVAALRLLGYERAEDLLGRHMHEAIHHTRPDGSPFPAAACPLLHTLSSGRAVRLDRELLWRRDGTAFTAQYSSYALRDDDEAVVGSVITFTDLSASGDIAAATSEALWNDVERRQAEGALRTSEARFRALADNISQLAWMTDATGAIDWYNRRWYDYTGTVPEAMRGWGWKSVHHPDHLERVVTNIEAAFRQGISWEDTFPLRGRDGTFRWFLSRARPIRDTPDDTHPEGRILGWFGTNTDINDLREAEERLSAAMQAAEEANRAKSEFIANMSHELRTPLSAIIGYSEMMREEMADGAEPADLLADMGKVEGNARHLLGLINDVLDISKIESGKMEVFAESFDVARMLHEVGSTMDSLVAKKHNRLVVSADDRLGEMHTDTTKVRQILFNLLSNAAKFTDGGTITLSANRISIGPEDWLSFRVTDTGIGMTEAQLGKLFVRFSQADSSTTRRFGGTGLGLSISKAFSAMLGGDMVVESAPGEGTAFTLLLPATYRAPVVNDPEHPTGVDEAGVAGTPRGLVLLIDDDPAQCELMSRFLAREGFASRVAADGESGIALAAMLQPRVILLDVLMPGMDGWKVLSALKADPETAAIPVVMVSFSPDLALSSALGAAGTVHKPVDWSRLRGLMERFRGSSGDVLLVDDDADARQHLRVTLERDGWAVREAGHGAEALAFVTQAPPGLILLDLTMPVMDGFDFLIRLRQQPGCADVPVIVLTAKDITNADRARLAGTQVIGKGQTSLQEIAAEVRRLHGDRDPAA